MCTLWPCVHMFACAQPCAGAEESFDSGTSTSAEYISPIRKGWATLRTKWKQTSAWATPPRKCQQPSANCRKKVSRWATLRILLKFVAITPKPQNDPPAETAETRRRGANLLTTLLIALRVRTAPAPVAPTPPTGPRLLSYPPGM